MYLHHTLYHTLQNIIILVYGFDLATPPAPLALPLLLSFFLDASAATAPDDEDDGASVATEVASVTGTNFVLPSGFFTNFPTTSGSPPTSFATR